MSISIVHIITTIDLGGAEKQLFTLARKQQEMGDYVKVIFLKGSPELLKLFLTAGIKVDTTFSKKNFLKQILQLSMSQISENTIYHAHLPRAELLCAIALRPKSFIVTRHNSEPFFPKAPAFMSRILSQFVLRRAFASVSISKAVNNFLHSSREVSRNSSNEVIYYGLSDTSVKHNTHFESECKTFEIGTVSRLVAQKNIPLLIHSVEILNRTKPARFNLTILGSGPMKDELENLTIQLGLKGLVRFEAKSENVTKFYKSLHIFVLTSNYEGFGLVLLEAMSEGVPIVARNISAIPEVLGENHPGLFSYNNPNEVANKIWSFLIDKEKKNLCIMYQSQRLKTFTIDKTEVAHKSLYNRLLRQKMLGTK